MDRKWQTTRAEGLAEATATAGQAGTGHTHTHTWDRLAFPGEGKQAIVQD